MKNSKLFIAVIFFSIIFTGFLKADTGQTIATGVGRGIVNLVTCPAEIAHYIVYDTADINVPGILTGLAKGTVFTIGRAFGGLSDVLSLGFIPDDRSLYKQMDLEYYVWDEQWLPKEESKIKSIKTEKK